MGVVRLIICSQTAQIAAIPGISIIKDNNMLVFARLIKDQEIAKNINKLTRASSMKSIESANKETDLIFNATTNSIKK